MALIASEASGIRKGDLSSLKGKKIAASFGTINHLYALALLEKAGLTPADVTLVNTPPPDMTVALLSKDRKSTRLNSSHANISYAVFCLKKNKDRQNGLWRTHM